MVKNYSSTGALTGQASAQEPQEMHSSALITNFPSPSVMQPTGGGTPSTKRPEYYGGTIPWLRTQEVDFKPIYSTELFITEDGLNNSSAKWIPENTVIVAMLKPVNLF